MGSFRKPQPADADNPIILTPSEGGVHVRAAQARGRRVWSGHSGARFSPSFTPVNIVNGVNIAGNTRLRRTASLVNTVNIGMLGGREAPLPPAGLQPEDSGRPLILLVAYGEAGERDNAPGD